MTRLIVFILLYTLNTAFGYDPQCNDNIVSYWGQNSYGTANSSDIAGWQKPLRFYCEDNTIDALPIAFLTTFFGTGGYPEINLANYCSGEDNGTFAGTGLANCQNMASDIDYCQKKGRLVTISLGGATSSTGFQSDEQASAFADTLWNMFLGGTSNQRPFGNVTLDGLDLDIESGGSDYYLSFLKKLDSYFKTSTKKYYVTAAPQCVYPDANLQVALNGYPFDAVYVQFYNNPCGLQNFNESSQWNFGTWDEWARTVSPNPDVKIFIGAPASPSAANRGYVPTNDLLAISQDSQKMYSSFGGVMFWDASQAYMNNRIDSQIKAGLQANRSCNSTFEYPPCLEPEWKAGTSYGRDSHVSYNSSTWVAKWTTDSPPSTDVNSDWAPVGPCSNSTGNATVTSSNNNTNISISNTATIIPSTIYYTSLSCTTIISTHTTVYGDSLPPSHKVSTTVISTPTTGYGHSLPPSSKVATTIISTPAAVYGHSLQSEISTTAVSQQDTTAHVNSTPTTTVTLSNVRHIKNICIDVSDWSPSQVYIAKERVKYRHHLWEAGWGSTNDIPGVVGVWKLVSSCSSLKRSNASINGKFI
ncbi:glycoside hydrolase superfamily [Pilobolus umbonatus]|nr:glycoside hydrolase superfamily [Pilobolus umbonatus]